MSRSGEHLEELLDDLEAAASSLASDTEQAGAALRALKATFGKLANSPNDLEPGAKEVAFLAELVLRDAHYNLVGDLPFDDTWSEEVEAVLQEFFKDLGQQLTRLAHGLSHSPKDQDALQALVRIAQLYLATVQEINSAMGPAAR